jgi:hypothetical protein
MPTIAVAWVLTILGLLFILLGFAGAVRTMFTNPQVATRGADYSKMIDALAGLVRALSAAPQWLALTVLGLIMEGGAVFVAGLR